MTELGSRPERRLTELWHFGGVHARAAQACHDVRRARLDSAQRRWQGSGRGVENGEVTMVAVCRANSDTDTYPIFAFENAFGKERVVMFPLLR